MAIGRLQAALAAATNEVTVAAANLNFDFTLVKYEAPKEYQALGNVLTSKRKDDAELGSIHVLARQLGALFDGICPATPALLEAYGKRASEIAKASKVISEPYAGTLFGDYTGIDGTSIWAAATSSKCALHVHLLACLLARVWTAPEAIAIWVEIVAERKREIARKVDNEEPVAFSLAAAVGQDISRSQLAVWDTSARAWLRTADDVFCRQQKQLELILKNIDLAAPGGPAVFPSVIETWKIAITTMDRLISGIPQAVQDAAALLGLSAWHLYPDLSLYDPEMVEVKMGDSLVDTGGVLSIGVSKRPDITGRENSIYWSLSLAQLRYYGHPVKVERGLGAECRLTLAQLDLVIFAVLLEEWKYEESESESVARAVISLVDRVNMSQLGSLHEKRLLKILRDGASALINPLNGSQDMTRRLIQLGRRRALRLLYNSNDPRKLDEQSTALFDLLDGENFMSLFRDTESQIRFLRHKAELLTSENIPSDAYIIRYTQPGTPWVDESSALDKDRPPCRSSAPNTPRLAGSTATTTLEGLSLQTPNAPETLVERPAAKDTPRQEPHANRISSEYSTAAVNDQTDSEGESDSDYSFESEAEILEDDVDVSDAEEDQNTHRPVAVSHAYGNGSRYYLLATALIPVPCGQAENTPHHRWVPKHLRGVAIPDGEVITHDMDEKFNLWHDCIKIVATEPSDDYVYHHVMGNTTTAALFARKIPDVFVPDYSDATIEDLQWCLDNDLLSPTNLIHHICISESSRVSKTLAAFAKAALIYDGLTDATVDANILNSTLTSKHWASETWRVTMSLERTLSLIAHFESGTHDVDPHQLKNVIAVSYANSLFVASALIQDPLETMKKPYYRAFRRILGNIGKPGLTFLLPPQEPITREINIGGWNIGGYRRFDGTKGSSFESTSVHLSFTEYHVPLFDGSRGAHDNQISFVESVISVQDKGKWVADIDPIPLVDGYRGAAIDRCGTLRRFDTKLPCQHAINTSPDYDATAVDTWDELLDMPTGICVIRAGNNWVGRLASTLVAFQRMRENSTDFAITVCPTHVCWICERSSFRHHAYIY